MIIAPSLLAANFRQLAKETVRASRSGADWLHLDIMDGHFVPNISFGPAVVAALRPLTRLFFDVHLMCSRPEILLEPFARAGADSLTIHVELADKVDPLLWKIQSLGIKTGLALNPSTPLQAALPFLKRVDLVLVMTVHPGFGGQPFIEEMLPKVQQLQQLRRKKNLDFRIQVDGGVGPKTAAEAALAGADTFVSGTALFSSRNMKAAVRNMRKGIALAAKEAKTSKMDSEPAAR